MNQTGGFAVMASPRLLIALGITALISIGTMEANPFHGEDPLTDFKDIGLGKNWRMTP